jgi:DNA-binding MarR family transcriptional regulator
MPDDGLRPRSAADEDEVDGVVAAWASVRPDLDTAPMQMLSRIRRIAQQLDAVSRYAFAQHGLAQHEFDVLAALRRSPSESLTPGRLAEATHVTSGTMTNRLDRLESRRLIIRRSDPVDGRQSVVRLTALGRRRVDAAIESLLAAEGDLVGGLPANDSAATVRVLRGLLVRRDRLRAR